MDKRGMNGINNGHFGVLGKEYGVLGGRPRKTVNQYTKYGDFVNQFKSITEASKQTGVLACGISNVMNGKAKTSGGFIWRETMVEDDEDF